MPFKNFEEYAKEEGYCCPLHLLADRVRWSNEALAEDASVTERAIRFWRTDYKRGKVQCRNAKNCMVIRALAILDCQTTLEHPDTGSGSVSAPEGQLPHA